MTIYRRCNMRRFGALIICVIALFSFTGCTGMIARAIVPDVRTHLNEDELNHLDKVNKWTKEDLLSLSKLDNKKTAVMLAKFIDKSSKRASDIKPSAAENAMQQYMRMVGREGVEEQIGVGIEWTKGLVTQVAGGGLAGSGMIAGLVGLLRRGNRKDRALKVVSSELDENAKAKVKKALEHTGMEKEIT
jgi:hypothetical protein